MLNKLSNRKGMGLVEGIVAALIFMIAFAGMAHIYVLCKKKLVVSNTKLMAINYARETLDRLRSIGRKAHHEPAVFNISPPVHPDFLPPGDRGWRRTYTVEWGPNDYAASSGERYKIIKVEVEWVE
ncbi:MAG: hypothetical protein B5M48_02270 [Candidatus Omnitrophica bacterium 4484_213]|nr:MAG: hypothetical protein B5M48_02270 [Candidatus Omnitrophica bacterium 4484_213]